MPMTHVQNANGGSAGAVTSTAATGSAIGNGNVVCGVVFWHNTSGTLTSITDDKGNTYTIVDKIQDAGGGNFFNASFYLTNITNGPSTITANLNSSTTGAQITWDEYSGLSSGASLDGHNGQSQNSPGTGADAISSGSFATAFNGDLIWAGGYAGNQITGAGTGFALRLNGVSSNGIVFLFTEDKTQSAAGSVAGTATDTAHGSSESTNVVALAIGVSVVSIFPAERGPLAKRVMRPLIIR